jgi:hypothetical protein
MNGPEPRKMTVRDQETILKAMERLRVKDQVASIRQRKIAIVAKAMIAFAVSMLVLVSGASFVENVIATALAVIAAELSDIHETLRGKE